LTQSDKPFIVGEITKNYVDGQPVGSPQLLSMLFEQMIEHNRLKGYRLHTWQLHRLYRRVHVEVPGTTSGRVLQEALALEETIIAVFEKADGIDNCPVCGHSLRYHDAEGQCCVQDEPTMAYCWCGRRLPGDRAGAK
jgi:hypothetical protein